MEALEGGSEDGAQSTGPASRAAALMNEWGTQVWTLAPQRWNPKMSLHSSGPYLGTR